jgi:hypothetical protein
MYTLANYIISTNFEDNLADALVNILFRFWGYSYLLFRLAILEPLLLGSPTKGAMPNKIVN